MGRAEAPRWAALGPDSILLDTLRKQEENERQERVMAKWGRPDSTPVLLPPARWAPERRQGTRVSG